MSSDEFELNDSHGGSSSAYTQSASEEADEQNISPSQNSTAARPDAASKRQKRLQRMASDLTYRQSRYRTLRGLYNDNYRVLYNETVKEAANPYSSEESSTLFRSQNGVTSWSAEEKEIFFHALSRYGQDNIQAISRAIKSKSEMEVRDHFLLLQESFIQRQVNDPYLKHALSLRDIPAAVELGQECCERLDLAGEALAFYQENFEAKEEQKKHGAYWLLDEDIAMAIEDAVSDELKSESDSLAKGKEGRPEHSDPSQNPAQTMDDSSLLFSIPAARLLNLRNWISLSEQLFMNSPEESGNWHHLAGVDEGPSMYYTAFDDFHRLVVSITRRLVQATIFQSLSRLRAQDFRTRGAAMPRVMTRDVVTAIDILGMPRSSREYWINLPRRSGIMVYDVLPRFTIGYDDVETELRKPSAITESITRLVKNINHEDEQRPNPDELHNTPYSHGTQEDQQDLSQTDTNSSESEVFVSDDIDALPLQARRRKRLRQRVEDGQVQDAERADQQASVYEEELIWAMLGRDESPGMKVEKDEELKNVPIERREYHELLDWRRWTDYHAEWEDLNDWMEDDGHQTRPLKRRRRNIESSESDSFTAISHSASKRQQEDVGSDVTAAQPLDGHDRMPTSTGTKMQQENAGSHAAADQLMQDHDSILIYTGAEQLNTEEEDSDDDSSSDFDE